MPHAEHSSILLQMFTHSRYCSSNTNVQLPSAIANFITNLILLDSETLWPMNEIESLIFENHFT